MAGVQAKDQSKSSTSACTNSPSERWSGGVHLVLDCHLDAAWTLQSDFLGLTKWVPTITTSRLVEGEINQPGCLRYCTCSGPSWVHERLLELDDCRHYMSYVMEDNHLVFCDGFHGYVAKVHLVNAGEGRTWVNWTYEVSPVATQTRDSLTTFMIDFYTLNLKHLETGANKLVAAAATLQVVSRSLPLALSKPAAARASPAIVHSAADAWTSTDTHSGRKPPPNVAKPSPKSHYKNLHVSKGRKHHAGCIQACCSSFARIWALFRLCRA